MLWFIDIIVALATFDGRQNGTRIDTEQPTEATVTIVQCSNIIDHTLRDSAEERYLSVDV